MDAQNEVFAFLGSDSFPLLTHGETETQAGKGLVSGPVGAEVGTEIGKKHTP